MRSKHTDGQFSHQMSGLSTGFGAAPKNKEHILGESPELTPRETELAILRRDSFWINVRTKDDFWYAGLP